ncbi:cytidine deaminase [Halobacillus sp. Nhm2S1]|uniref:cytidine deaminase n=1 Tax=Halobacillus sp. Nhm2S1 TaxID=2866716 RepID=UPI001C72B091|nr:cytidine deaminase [Halobacillus sp. Nhm2S1]MBX0358398.1 cytidine deaminase [Halobacillus sp. Nhm2S1]
MNRERDLYEEAKALIQHRYPSGWGGAAALRLEGGTILTSVAPDVINDAVNLCMETGAILEAHKRNMKVTHSLCIARDDESSSFKVLSPCGVCQERLFYWGDEVKVAVTHPGDELMFKTLAEVQPYHWSRAYKEELETSNE